MSAAQFVPLALPAVAPGSALRRAALGLALLGLLGGGAAAACAEDTAPVAPAAPTTEAEVVIPWVRNWGDAQAQAKKDNKDLLINFTGSDWCGWCTRLESEVFAQAAFLEKATKDFVFVFLDFPQAAELKAAVVDAALNEKLKATYEVKGFPSILLTTAEGLPYGRTGYQEGGPEGYLTHLAELRAAGAKIKALIAKGKTEMAAFKPGFEALIEAGLLAYPAYSWVIDHAEAKDKDGALGLKPAVEKERARQRGLVEEQALGELLKGKQRKEDVDWVAVHALLKNSKDLGGNMLFQFSLHTGDWLVGEGRFAEAKEMYLLPMRDTDIAGNERARGVLEQKAASCDEAAAAPKEAPKDEPKDEPKGEPTDAPK